MVGSSRRAVIFTFLCALSFGACSGDDDENEEPATESGTCNGATSSEATCTEYKGEPSLIYESREYCDADGQAWTTDPCPTADLVGCCRSTFSGDQYLECYYSAYLRTAMELEGDCIDFFMGSWTTGGRG